MDALITSAGRAKGWSQRILSILFLYSGMGKLALLCVL